MARKPLRATLEHQDNRRVNDCIIIRREGPKNDGDFYYVTVSKNGLYLDRVLSLSTTASSCVAKMKAARKVWSDTPRFRQIWYDYPGARRFGTYLAL